MEQNILTAEELLELYIVSGGYILEKFDYHPEDIIHLLNAGKINAYQRLRIPRKSLDRKVEYRLLRHYETKNLPKMYVRELYFSRKEIENLNVKEAGRKTNDYKEFKKYAVYLKKENPGLTKLQALKDDALIKKYPTHVEPDTMRKAIAKVWKEAGLDYKDKSGRPKNRT